MEILHDYCSLIPGSCCVLYLFSLWLSSTCVLWHRLEGARNLSLILLTWVAPMNVMKLNDVCTIEIMNVLRLNEHSCESMAKQIEFGVTGFPVRKYSCRTQLEETRFLQCVHWYYISSMAPDAFSFFYQLLNRDHKSTISFYRILQTSL